MPTLHVAGWLLFIVSSLLFTIAGVRAGDWLVTAASVIFGVACVLFLVPDNAARRDQGDSDGGD